MTASDAEAADRGFTPQVTTSGKGAVVATPDIARINLGVTSMAPTAAAAMKANSRDMRQVIAAIKAAGIQPRDIQTSNLNVHPRMQHFRDGKPPKVTGYQVDNQVHLTVRDLDKLGDILDEALSAGANQVHGISFDVSETKKLIDEARGDAVKDARRKAELYAKAAGARVGNVIVISEQGSSHRYTEVVQQARMARAAAPPVERGSKTLEVRVIVTWALE